MANVVNGNTLYLDATGVVTSVPTLVYYVSLTATAASSVLVLQDSGAASANKLSLRVVTSGETQLFDFSRNPIFFPNGLRVGTITNAIATAVK